MPDHDLLGPVPEQKASTLMYRATCRCGDSWLRPSKELAESAWEAHWRAEDALPRIAELRQTLRGSE